MKREGIPSESVVSAPVACRWRRALVAIASGLLLAGCGGSGASPTATPAPTATATPLPPTATPIPAAKVGKVVWSTSVAAVSNAPDGEVERFRTSARTLYAVVRVTNLRAGSVLSAEWTYNQTSLESATSAVVPPRSYPAGFVQFHLTRSSDEPWPDGVYSITISLDGDVVQTADVDVEAS